VLYGAEPAVPYDRVRLSSYLAGEVDRADMDLPDRGPAALTARYTAP
jgi:NAD(P)H-nitrite reductase large subunit